MVCGFVGVFLLWMKGSSYENLEQIFRAALVASVSRYNWIRITKHSYLFELDGYPIIQCSATFGFLLVHYWFPAATSRGSKTRSWTCWRYRCYCTLPAAQPVDLTADLAVCGCWSWVYVTEREEHEMELSSSTNSSVENGALLCRWVS